MGQCYSVTLTVALLDEKGAVEALNAHMRADKSAYYALELYAEQGIYTETFDDLMRIFLAGWKGQEVTIERDQEYTYYSNDFHATYGWEPVMMKMFQVLTPFLKDGSELLIYPDDDYDRLIVKDGKCVQVH